MRVKEVLNDENTTVEQAITSNMLSAIKSRRMRDGKLSVDALKGVMDEAKVWAEAYVKQAKDSGRNTSGVMVRMAKAIKDVYERHIVSAVYITNYKK